MSDAVVNAVDPAGGAPPPGSAAPPGQNGAPRGRPAFPSIAASGPPPKTPITTDAALVDHMESVYRFGGSAKTAENYGRYARAFLQAVQSQGHTFATMPPGTMQAWLTSTFATYTAHNAAMAGLRALLVAAQAVHYEMSPQVTTPAKKPKKEPPPMTIATVTPSLAPAVPPVAGAPPANGAVAAGPQMPDPGIVHGSSQSTVEAAVAGTTGAPTSGPPAVAPPLSRPAGVQRPPNGSQQKITPVLPSLGGRVRISKRIDGYEGTGAPIGTRAVCGDYTLDDVEVEGSVMKFILNALRPHYGPKVGQTAATYYVERLDNVGNPIPGSLSAIPVFPDVAMGGMGVTAPTAPQAQATQPPAPAQPAMTPDREETFIRYLMDRQKSAEEKYERLLEEVRAKAASGGSDVATLMLLAERAKPEPLDVEAAVAKFRKSQAAVEPLSTTPSPAPTFPNHGGLGGFGDPFAPPPPSSSDKVVEALLGQVKDLSGQVRDLAVRAATPPPTPPTPPATDPLAIITGFAAAMKAFAPPPDPLREAMLSKLIAETGKTKSLAETLADLRAVQQFVGGDGGVPWGEIVATAVENLPQILQSIGSMKAPTLPRRQPAQPAQPTQAAAPTAPPAQPKPAGPPKLPEEGQKAFITLAQIPPGEEHDQQVVETVYAILGVLAKSEEPWNLIAKRVIETYVKLDTKAEVRAILTNLFVWCGAARKFMTDALLDRMTDVFHTHYTLIYTALTGGQTRTLKDAPEASASEQPEVAEETAEEVEPCEDCGHPEHGNAACGYCKSTAECAKPREDEDEEEEEEQPTQPTPAVPSGPPGPALF